MINPIFEIDNIIFDEVYLIWHRGNLVPYNIQLEEYGYFRPTLRYKDSLVMFVDTQVAAKVFCDTHKGFYFTILRNMREIDSSSVLTDSCKQIDDTLPLNF